MQNGNDDRRTYYVSSEKLKELVNTCKKVLNDKSLAPKLLPTQEGFFFGSIKYDMYYFRDLKDTIEQLKDLSDNSYYYKSSW